MVNKEIYKSAMDKIKTDSKFKERAFSAVEKAMPLNYRIKRYALAAVLVLVVLVNAAIFSPFLKGNVSPGKTGDFKIISNSSDSDASYVSVLFLDGYVYSPSEWLKYSIYGPSDDEYESMKDRLLGKVTLDLKRKQYTGTPPDFSSTHDVGSEIYSIRNVKKERAVLVADKGVQAVFFRIGKASDENSAIGLCIFDVFRMISDSAGVSSVELRDERDGSWMRTSEDMELLSLINDEFPKLPLQNYAEIGKDTAPKGYRIPVNLIFKDGAALHMQVFPETRSASVFGGYVILSDRLCSAFEKLYNSGGQYPSISSLIPYKEDEISYLHFSDYVNNNEVDCKNPAWSRTGLFSILNYYRVEEVQEDTGAAHVMGCIIGKSGYDSIKIDFYEAQDKQILVKIDGRYYRPVKGKLGFDVLESYLVNNTDLGLKTENSKDNRIKK